MIKVRQRSGCDAKTAEFFVVAYVRLFAGSKKSVWQLVAI